MNSRRRIVAPEATILHRSTKMTQFPYVPQQLGERCGTSRRSIVLVPGLSSKNTNSQHAIDGGERREGGLQNLKNGDRNEEDSNPCDICERHRTAGFRSVI